MNSMAKTKDEPIEEAELNNNSSSSSRDLGSDLRIPAATNNPSQMTIFYKGSVAVFDSITPQRAMAIVRVASAAANANVPAMSSSPCSQSSVAASPRKQKLQTPQNLVFNVANRKHLMCLYWLASRSPFIVKNKPKNIECQESCAGNEPSTPMSRYVETSKSD